MKKYISIVALFLSWSGSTIAQTTDLTPAELNSTPPAIISDVSTPAPTENPASSVVKSPRKITYSLLAGTQFSPLLGTATFLEPSVLFPITKRLSGYAGVSLLTNFGPNRHLIGRNDEFTSNYASFRNQRFILHAGGNYLVNDRLNLTGNVWRDFSSKNQMPTSVNLLMPGGTNGMSLRATYKVTENFSVSGGIRYSNGNAYQNQWYNSYSPYSF